MTPEQKNELARMAKNVLLLTKEKIYLPEFGLAIFAHTSPKEEIVSFSGYCEQLFGFSGKSEPYTFLFSGKWPNKREQFAARAYVYLKQGLPIHRQFYLSWVEREPEDFNQWIL